ncbi:DUF2330 domain-containing protein [Paraliomyxa miuraensis]|uniref:DUF2330 domain-containing protein n=1 Tax=Paraliomyxa miuraensis TaxID=376150 RepID=UPI00225B1DBC|nr:DUF2330 domain-containing protein [Paraliomyxa miuraensis]MCX4242789.1 DUF2330 domain-containing protein [Paraliomyxa miuraensis]
MTCRCSLLLASLTLALPLALAPAPARACGGMVFPDHGQRQGGMSDQELLVAFEAQRTVLVASAGYEGIDASDFAFVLPLAQAPTEVLDADPALLLALDEHTAPEVAVHLDEGPDRSLGCGAKSGSNDLAGGRGEGGGDVMVQQRGTTATYEWVVIGGDTGMALADWLGAEGYALPPDYATALDPYVTDGWFFFAAKVRPQAQDGALVPIELHLPASTPETFEIPFGLASHSLEPDEALGITLYLWSDGAVLPDGRASGRIDPSELVALSDHESNYPELEQMLLGSDPGGTWIIDYGLPTTADELRRAYAEGVDWGRVDPDQSNEAFIGEFFGRLGSSSGHLTRLRTELRAEQLHDLRLRRSTESPGGRFYEVTYDDTAGSACTVGRGGRIPGAVLLLLPLVAWLRPRD